eukprot:CAMPEP_0196582054 /NCGR_PEP_ID=MMETSP1081-20130531/37244_1 /TAXON_ID=36882 /ORGANISM="Pyramimonas amylifera, Strain CCMP720" /LENGTH=87 /DNA_ID=CAMNT_0041902517 /DNA_START=183 /DNA_END=446 /DNA_ORIENTATION=-
MQVVGELRTSRKPRVPTPQSKSEDDGTFAKFHPALLLPDPALVGHSRMRAYSSSPYPDFPASPCRSSSTIMMPSEGSFISRPTTSQF